MDNSRESLEIEEMTDIMTNLYHNRLKSLIGYEDVSHTRSIIENMFNRFKKLDTESSKIFLSNILSFMYKASETSYHESAMGMQTLLQRLEEYQTGNLNFAVPSWKRLMNEQDVPDHREFIFSRFEEIKLEQSERFSTEIQVKSIKDQLKSTTFYRNHIDHPGRNYSAIYTRYYILHGYNLILTYLLYTFIFMAIETKDSFIN